MDSVVKTIEVGVANEVIEVVPFGDLHTGCMGFDEETFCEARNYVRDNPLAYWIGMGDYAEFINYTDKRFDPYSIHPDYKLRDMSRLIQKQLDGVTKLFDPIKDKCLGLIIGNHEESIRLKYHYSVGYELAKNLKARCLGYTGHIRIRFLKVKNKRKKTQEKMPSSTYDFYIIHGYGGARKTGGKANRIEDQIAGTESDVVIMAHEHQKMIVPPVVRSYMDINGNIKWREHWGFMSGCFKRGHVEHSTSYEERKGYKESSRGTVKIMLHTGKRKIEGATF